MGSSKCNNEIFDFIRGIWVKRTPEEVIRQKVIQKMIFELGFPKEMITVERELSGLGLKDVSKIPNRRLDILCFAKNPEHGLLPLLLIECKKEKISKESLEQVLGYNHYVGASFIATIGINSSCFARVNKEGQIVKFMRNFLPYQELIKLVMQEI